MLRRLTLFALLIIFSIKGYSQCAGTQTDSVYPQPINGHYFAGTVVHFCYTIAGWTNWGSNDLHGMVLSTLGAGWDTGSITMTMAPGSCDGHGVWKYFPHDTSHSTHQIFGPGFYYDRGANLGDTGNNIAGDNFGDHSVSGTCVWNLCFSIKVKSICSGSDLSVAITATGDGTTGAWVNTPQQCTGTPFSLTTATCMPNCNLTINLTATKTSCAFHDGTVTPAFTGGTPPYNYSWNTLPVQNTAEATGLGVGNYCITVTDANLCTIVSCADVVENNTVTISSAGTDVTCFGFCDGTATVNALTGVSPFIYTWSPTEPPQSNITGLCAGTFNCTVTDKNSCKKYATILVNQYLSLSDSTQVTPVTCHGDSNGVAVVIPLSGIPPYTYHWFNGSTDSMVTNLKAGIYMVTLTDAHGCSLDVVENVTEPPPVDINPTIRDASCNDLRDGYVSVAPTKGVPPYSIFWSYLSQTTNKIDSLATGIYDVTVTDANGCSTTGAYFVTEPPVLGGVLIPTPASCPGATDGSIELIPYGGTPPYQYQWNTSPVQTTATATHLAPGYYIVALNDSVGCKIIFPPEEVKALPLFVVSAGKNIQIDKFQSTDLSLSVNQSGDYRFVWSPPIGLNDTGLADPTASPPATTTYYVEVINVHNGCRAEDSVVVEVVELPDDDLYVPNAFSPNGDGQNDLFFPIAGELVKIIDFKIFDRWGNLVFDSPNGKWNGTSLSGREEEVGAYAYYVVYTVGNSSQQYKKKGSVTLIR